MVEGNAVEGWWVVLVPGMMKILRQKYPNVGWCLDVDESVVKFGCDGVVVFQVRTEELVRCLAERRYGELSRLLKDFK
jgi:hypothetical protein